MKIRVNDSVIVLAGKDRGQTGIVSKLSLKNNTVVVDGLNKRTKHIKARNGNPGDRVSFSAPMDISNVALVDPKTGKPTRVQYKIEGKSKIRVSAKSGEVLTGQEKAKETKTKTTPSKNTKTQK